MARLFRNFLTRRLHDRHLQAAIGACAKGKAIDIGCGTKPYGAMLDPYVDEHIGLDHPDSLHDQSAVDLPGTAYAIPQEDGTYDTALCTAVLEHLEEPETALRECYRVLKPGGRAIYTVPFIWHLHEEPRDFYRFSRHGLNYLFSKVGYDEVEITAMSGFWVTFGQLLVYNLHRFHKGFMRFIPIIPLIGLLIQVVAGLLDRFDRTEQWTWMYLVVAKKPVSVHQVETKSMMMTDEAGRYCHA